MNVGVLGTGVRNVTRDPVAGGVPYRGSLIGLPNDLCRRAVTGATAVLAAYVRAERARRIRNAAAAAQGKAEQKNGFDF